MKKILILLSFVFAICFVKAQGVEVSQINGKVVFTDTIPTLLSDSEVHARLQSWYDEYSKDRKKSEVILDNTDMKAVEYRFLDYMEMEKSALYIYSIYMRYSVRIIYGDNKCVVRVNRISYIEPEDLQKQDRYDILIPAENILLKRKYKVALIPNPIEKIQDHTFLTIENMFSSIKKSL